MPHKAASLRIHILPILDLVLPASPALCSKASRSELPPVCCLSVQTFLPPFLWRIKRGLYCKSPLATLRKADNYSKGIKKAFQRISCRKSRRLSSRETAYAPH